MKLEERYEKFCPAFSCFGTVSAHDKSFFANGNPFIVDSEIILIYRRMSAFSI